MTCEATLRPPKADVNASGEGEGAAADAGPGAVRSAFERAAAAVRPFLTAAAAR